MRGAGLLVAGQILNFSVSYTWYRQYKLNISGIMRVGYTSYNTTNLVYHGLGIVYTYIYCGASKRYFTCIYEVFT